MGNSLVAHWHLCHVDRLCFCFKIEIKRFISCQWKHAWNWACSKSFSIGSYFNWQAVACSLKRWKMRLHAYCKAARDRTKLYRMHLRIVFFMTDHDWKLNWLLLQWASCAFIFQSLAQWIKKENNVARVSKQQSVIFALQLRFNVFTFRLCKKMISLLTIVFWIGLKMTKKRQIDCSR